jgi:hypothetical protein
MSDIEKAVLDLTNRGLARHRETEWIATLADGSTVHAIDSARSSGPAKPLEGLLLVEDNDGNIRRMNGAQLAEFAALAPIFLKHWRIKA